MTNAEKYKTVAEREKAYKNHMNTALNNHENVLPPFEWLAQEAPAEEPLPCPFCGSNAITFIAQEMFYVSCVNEDCIASVPMNSFSSEEDAIAAWNRRVK